MIPALVPQPKAWQGHAKTVRSKWTKLQTGQYGEAVAQAWLRQIGIETTAANIAKNNAAFDLIGTRAGKTVAIEVKAGVVSNGDSAMHWRATIGQPGPSEARALERMPATQKARHNAAKQRAIVARKTQLARDVGATEQMTVGLIIDPDGRTTDVYLFNGFHLRLGWKSDATVKAYQGSFRWRP